MSILSDLVAIYDESVSIHRGYARHGIRAPFSKASGVDHTIISNWRRKKNGARLDTAEAVANALGYRLVLQKIEAEP